MNLSAPFIRRPVMTTLVMASCVAFGVAAYRQVSTVYAPEDQYQVILSVLPEHKLDPDALSLLRSDPRAAGSSRSRRWPPSAAPWARSP